jgi:hypothetical protein
MVMPIALLVAVVLLLVAPQRLQPYIPRICCCLEAMSRLLGHLPLRLAWLVI